MKTKSLIKALAKRPMSYREMQRYLWHLSGKKGDPSRGYWSTNIRDLLYKSMVIKKGGDGKYRPTTYGLRAEHPFTRRPEDTIAILEKQCRTYRNRWVTARNELYNIHRAVERALGIVEP